MRTQLTKICLSISLAAASIGLSSPVRAADDTPRFSGTWRTNIPCNGQFLTVASVHDGNGFKNYLVLPGGSLPVGDGTFSAADGKCTVTQVVGTGSGTYQFIDDNTLFCKDAAGKACVWHRDNSPLPPVISTPGYAAMGSQSLSPATNLAALKVSEAIDLSQRMAHSWRPDAILVLAKVTGPGNDGTVNVLSNPGAITMLFYSPSTTNGLAIVSTVPAGTLFATQTAGLPGQSLLPVPPQSLDLTTAVAAARQAGLNGSITQAELSVYQKPGRQPCLAWALYGQEMYPRVVSAATGTMLSPFEVVDDKVAYYNQLAAANARAVQSSGGRGSAGSVFWAGPSQESSSTEQASQQGSSQINTDNDPDDYNNSVGAQNAFDDGNSAAQARFNDNTPTSEDISNYSSGE